MKEVETERDNEQWPCLDNIYIDTSAVLLDEELVDKVSSSLCYSPNPLLIKYAVAENCSRGTPRHDEGVSLRHQVLHQCLDSRVRGPPQRCRLRVRIQGMFLSIPESLESSDVVSQICLDWYKKKQYSHDSVATPIPTSPTSALPLPLLFDSTPANERGSAIKSGGRASVPIRSKTRTCRRCGDPRSTRCEGRDQRVNLQLFMSTRGRCPSGGGRSTRGSWERGCNWSRKRSRATGYPGRWVMATLSYRGFW